MDILQASYLANPILIIIMALGLGYFLIRKYHLRWRLFFVGGATYSGVFVISLLFSGFLNVFLQSISTWLPNLFLALISVVCLIGLEESIRYAMYRWWAKDSRSLAEGLVLGSGHGGLEIIILGLYMFFVYFNMVSLRNADLATIYPGEDVANITKLVTQYWSESWYNTFTEALRSALTLPIQLSCSLLVLQVFLRKQYRWLGYAIGWHVLASTPLFLISSEPYVYLPLIFLAVATLGSIGIIIRLRSQQEQDV